MPTPDNEQPAPKIELSITPEPHTDDDVRSSGNPGETADDETADDEAVKAEALIADKPEAQPQQPSETVSEAAQVREAYDQFINNDAESTDISLKTVLGGDLLATQWFRKQLPFILFLSVLALFYVSNRYSCQQETIDRKKLTNRLEDRRKRAIVAECNLTEFCRRSNIQSLLRDTTLRMSNDSYYYIKATRDSVPQ